VGLRFGIRYYTDGSFARCSGCRASEGNRDLQTILFALSGPRLLHRRDKSTGTAIVVDPQRDTDQYLAFAAEHGLKIKHVFLTHLHADFVAGHLELRDRAGATIHLGAAAKAGYAFTPAHDGEVLEFGKLRLKILETPGHTPESISILVYDLEKNAAQPHAILTGDTLFIGDVGRPDLRAALGWSATDLGGLLFDSLHTKLLALPDQSLVYPAHGAGSLCGKALSKETFSTLGEQRRNNYALQPMTKQAFIEVVTADQPEAPAYFTYDAVLNSQEHPTLDETLARCSAMSLDDLLALQSSGAQILDTRDPAEFASAHLAGSINVGLGGQYATWAGTILDHEHPIVIIADPGRESESITRLGRIGFDHIVGYLQDGLHSLKSRPDLTVATQRVSAQFAAELLASPHPPAVVDVRTPRERDQKHIAGSLSLPLNHLQEKLTGEKLASENVASETSNGEKSSSENSTTENLKTIPPGRPLLVYCAGGYRSSIAASLLQRAGHRNVSEIAGGIAAWEAANLPLQSTTPSKS